MKTILAALVFGLVSMTAVMAGQVNTPNPQGGVAIGNLNNLGSLGDAFAAPPGKFYVINSSHIVAVDEEDACPFAPVKIHNFDCIQAFLDTFTANLDVQVLDGDPVHFGESLSTYRTLLKQVMLFEERTRGNSLEENYAKKFDVMLTAAWRKLNDQQEYIDTPENMRTAG